jgi:hypothetical protein
MSADTGDLAPLLVDIHTKDYEHRKQGQGKKKCHFFSMLFKPIILPSN